MPDKKKPASFLKWLFSSKKAGDYGADPEDPMGLDKTGGRGDAEHEAAKELEEEYRKKG